MNPTMPRVSAQTTKRIPHLLMLMTLAATVTLARGADAAKPGTKSESLDHDPGWEGYNNHNVPKHARMVKQDFGYSKTQFASKNPGEIGGSFQRSSTPASYAAPLTPARTLDDKLTASGNVCRLSRERQRRGVFSLL